MSPCISNPFASDTLLGSYGKGERTLIRRTLRSLEGLNAHVADAQTIWGPVQGSLPAEHFMHGYVHPPGSPARIDSEAGRLQAVKSLGAETLKQMQI